MLRNKTILSSILLKKDTILFSPGLTTQTNKSLHFTKGLVKEEFLPPLLCSWIQPCCVALYRWCPVHPFALPSKAAPEILSKYLLGSRTVLLQFFPNDVPRCIDIAQTLWAPRLTSLEPSWIIFHSTVLQTNSHDLTFKLPNSPS
jgi:hypothetical protein